MGGTQTSVVAFDLDPTLQFLKSVAVPRAFVTTMTTGFDADDSNVAVNYMYNLMPWKGRMGTVGVTSPPKRSLETTAKAIYAEYAAKFLGHCMHGPDNVKLYLETLDKMKKIDLENMASVFQENAATNEKIFEELKEHIEKMALVRMRASIALAWLGAGAAIVVGGATGVAAIGICLVKGVTGTVVKEWNRLPDAAAIGVGITMESGKYVVHRSTEKVEEKILEDTEVFMKCTQRIENLNQKLAMVYRKPASRIVKRTTQKIAEYAVKRQAAQQLAKTPLQFAIRGGMAQAATKIVPVIFATWDTIEAVDEYNETMELVKGKE